MSAHQSELPVLYSFRRCPFAMRARLALVACGLKVEIREIVLRDKPAHMREISPKATVPVLWLPDGTVVDESLDVMRWAVRQADPMGLMNLQPRELELTQQWLAVLDGEFKHHLDRYKYPQRYEGVDPMEHRQAGVQILKQWGAALIDSDWLFGNSMRFVDLAILPFVRQFRIPEPQWFDSNPELAPVVVWLQRFLALPLFETAMQKFEPWKPGDPAVFFP